MSGLAEFSARNQAIGVLVEQGHTPTEARIEIGRRATRNAQTLNETAQDILDNLPERAVSTRLDPLRPNGVDAQGKRNPTLNPAVMHLRTDANNPPVVRMRQQHHGHEPAPPVGRTSHC